MTTHAKASFKKHVFTTAIDADDKLPDEEEIDVFVLHGECNIQWNCSDSNTQFFHLYQKIKELSGVWGYKFWSFDSMETRDEFLTFVAQILNAEDYKIIEADQEFSGTVINAVKMAGGAGFFYQGNPDITRCFLEYTWCEESQRKASQWWTKAPVVIPAEFEKGLEEFVEKGAIVKYREHTPVPVTVRKQRLIAELICKPLDDPSHYLLRQALTDTWKWTSGLPREKMPIPWDGIITMPVYELDDWLITLGNLGIPYALEETNVGELVPMSLNYESIPGWNEPAPNGKKLHQYQREGIEFAANKQGCILNADEMGTGKTVQTIGFAQGIHAGKVLIVAPANARYVWEREIREWVGPEETIQHITSSTDTVNKHVRWVIATYDVLVPRAGTIVVSDKHDKNKFRLAGKNSDKLELRELKNGTLRVSVRKNVRITGLTEAISDKLEKINLRLNGGLVSSLVEAHFDLLVADESHYLKNTGAKRTKSVACLAEKINKKILLSGTPIRNRPEEAASMLSILYPDAKSAIERIIKSSLCRKITLTRSLLSQHMVRRTKSEVLTQLPPKIRDWVEVVPNLKNDEDFLLLSYQMCMESARRSYWDHLRASDADDANAHLQNAFGSIEQARTVLGKIKIFDGELAAYIQNVIEQKGACIVFCAHHVVSDLLSVQLNRLNISNTIVDGRTKQIDRKKAEEEFQHGNIDVFIGGIRAAGESITLTRSDICIFVESDWVPAAMMQAEDRGHRIGQKSNGYQIVHWVVSPESGIGLDRHITDLLRRKIEMVDMVLNEQSDFKFSQKSSEDSIKSSLIRSMFGGMTVPESEPVGAE